jgi:hypothetical protein
MYPSQDIVDVARVDPKGDRSSISRYEGVGPDQRENEEAVSE